MKDPQRLESALRDLYRSGLIIRPRISIPASILEYEETRILNNAMQAAKEALESEPAGMQQLRCNRCAKTVSTLVPNGTIIRAWVECPECLAMGPEIPETEGIQHP